MQDSVRTVRRSSQLKDNCGNVTIMQKARLARRVWVYRPSAYGNDGQATEFLQMIEDSKKKTFDYVLVYQLDRFARNRYDSANYKAKLKKNGVRVLSAKENISEDASGILIEGVLESMAEYYSAELSQK